MSERNYYVICDDNCRFPAMTKEEILAAIAEATGTTPVSVDDAFIEKIKEQNTGGIIKIWAGTNAQYNALSSIDNNVLYIITDSSELTEFTARVNALETSIIEKESISNKVTSVTSGSNDTEYPTAKAVYTKVNSVDTAAEKTANKVTTINENSTNAQYPSAKAVNTIVNAVNTASEKTANKVTSVTDNSTDTQYPSAKAVYTKVNAVDTAAEKTANKVTSITDASTDTQYPTAKAVYTKVNAVDTSAEKTANKVTSVTDNSTDTQYPSAKAVNTKIKAHADKTNNPHAVTYAQTGAAAASHTHTGADITSGEIELTENYGGFKHESGFRGRKLTIKKTDSAESSIHTTTNFTADGIDITAVAGSTKAVSVTADGFTQSNKTMADFVYSVTTVNSWTVRKWKSGRIEAEKKVSYTNPSLTEWVAPLYNVLKTANLPSDVFSTITACKASCNSPYAWTSGVLAGSTSISFAIIAPYDTVSGTFEVYLKVIGT